MKQTLPFQLSCVLVAALCFVYLQMDVLAATTAELATPIRDRVSAAWLPWLGFLALLPAGASPKSPAIAAGSVVASLLLGPALALAVAAWRASENQVAFDKGVATGEYTRFELQLLAPAAIALVLGIAWRQWRLWQARQRSTMR